MKIDPYFSPALAATLLLWAAPGIAQETQDEEQTATEDTATEDPLEMRGALVTGARLARGDPTSRTEVITSEEINVRGLSTAEDVIRSIPQNFSSINVTNSNPPPALDGVNLGLLGLGTSAANLRGLGSANTLVLLNGRRVAGAAGREDFFANLRDIPAAAIERVEVHLEGASSIYGSDAVGGVINIVTKKDYAGGNIAARNEQSSTGADQTRYSAYWGYNWDNGSVSTNISYTKSKPYSARKAGHTTNDYSARYGGNRLANFNLNPSTGQPLYYRSGLVGFSPFANFFGGPFYILPPGNDGRNAQAADFRAPTLADGVEKLPVDAGGSTDDKSVTVNVEHTLFDKLRLRGEYLRTEAETVSRVTNTALGTVLIPASNAFNPFGRAVWVFDYDAQTEVDLGVLSLPQQINENESERITAGFDFAFGDDLEFSFNYLTSTSDRAFDQFTLGTRILFNPSLDPNAIASIQARIGELLASGDPNVAINLFGDGTGQNATIAELLIPAGGDQTGTEMNSIEAYLRGSLFHNLPAGAAGFVAGGEFREEILGMPRPLDGSKSFFEQIYGSSHPSRDLNAYFLEFSVPIFSRQNARPGFNSLTLVVQARRDEYAADGASGSNADGSPIIQTAKFAHTSPRAGLNWGITDNFTVRGSLQQSFRAPTVTDLFLSFGTGDTPSVGAWDFLHSRWVPTALSYSGGNIDLKPEYSDNLSLGMEWTPEFAPKLQIKIDWSRIDFQDRIAGSFELYQLLPLEVFGNLPELFVRDANGMLLEYIGRPVNIATRVSESLDVQMSWQFDTQGFGTFQPSIYYHRVLDQYDQWAEGSDKARFLGESIGLDKYKLQGRVEWYRDRLSADLYVQYTPSYINNNFEGGSFELPNMSIDSRVTVDLSVTYKWENGLLARIGGRNILDADFPFALGGGGRPYDPSRVDVRGQVWFAEVSWDLTF